MLSGGFLPSLIVCHEAMVCLGALVCHVAMSHSPAAGVLCWSSLSGKGASLPLIVTLPPPSSISSSISLFCSVRRGRITGLWYIYLRRSCCRCGFQNPARAVRPASCLQQKSGAHVHSACSRIRLRWCFVVKGVKK